ncbi:hemin-degrading factor, partial [Paraburkholderia sp. SIMBA_009]
MMHSALPGQPATPARAVAALRDAFVKLKTERQLRNRDV